MTQLHVAVERECSGHAGIPPSVLGAGSGYTSARYQNFATPFQLRDKIKHMGPQWTMLNLTPSRERTSCTLRAPERDVERGNPWWTLYSTRLPNMKPGVHREVSQNRPSVGWHILLDPGVTFC